MPEPAPEYIVTTTARTTERRAATILKNGLARYVAEVTDDDESFTSVNVELATDNDPGGVGETFAAGIATAVADELERRAQPAPVPVRLAEAARAAADMFSRDGETLAVAPAVQADRVGQLREALAAQAPVPDAAADISAPQET